MVRTTNLSKPLPSRAIMPVFQHEVHSSAPEMEPLLLRIDIAATLYRGLGENLVDFDQLSVGELDVAGREILQVALFIAAEYL